MSNPDARDAENASMFDKLSVASIQPPTILSMKSPRTMPPPRSPRNASITGSNSGIDSPRRRPTPLNISNHGILPLAWHESGGGGHKINCVDKLPSMDVLNKWEMTIAAARFAGQFSCSLGVLDSGQDFEWTGTGFRFYMHSPYESETMDRWRATHGVNFYIYVPTLKDKLAVGEKPQYPLHYVSFGYLMATWFVPHPNDMKKLEVGEVRTEMSIRNMLPAFDAKHQRARDAGQLECVLMTLGGSEFKSEVKETGDKVHIRHVMDKKYTAAIEWAVIRGVRLTLRVPENPYTEGLFFGETSPCLFAHLVASWEYALNDEFLHQLK